MILFWNLVFEVFPKFLSRDDVSNCNSVNVINGLLISCFFHVVLLLFTFLHSSGISRIDFFMEFWSGGLVSLVTLTCDPRETFVTFFDKTACTTKGATGRSLPVQRCPKSPIHMLLRCSGGPTFSCRSRKQSGRDRSWTSRLSLWKMVYKSSNEILVQMGF